MLNMKSIRFVALAIVIAVGVGGCASTTATPSSTPTAGTFTSAPEVPEQQRETGLVRPALVFDGLCGEVFSDAELASVFGTSLAPIANHFSEMWGGDALFNQNGGFECTWQGGEARVIALLLPEAAVDYTPVTSPCTDTHDTFYLTCELETVVNGIRLSGLSSFGLEEAAALAARDSLVAIFTEKASAQTPVPVPLPAEGSWQLPPECAAIAGAADFSAVPGLGAGTVNVEFGYGKDTTQAERALRGGWANLDCLLEGDSAQIEYIPIGGGRWREAEIATRSDVTALELEGVEAAYVVPYGDTQSIVYAFSGPNMLMFTVKFTKNAAGIASALITALDATALS